MQSPCLNTRVPPGGHNLPRVGSLSSESCFRLRGQHHRQVFVRPLQVYCLHHLPGEYSQQSWRASFFRLGLARWHFRARGLTSQRRPTRSLPAHEQPGNLPPVGFLFFFLASSSASVSTNLQRPLQIRNSWHTLPPFVYSLFPYGLHLCDRHQHCWLSLSAQSSSPSTALRRKHDLWNIR